MIGIVRELYKRLLFAGRSYPQGLGYVREKVKAGIAISPQIDMLGPVQSSVTPATHLCGALSSVLLSLTNSLLMSDSDNKLKVSKRIVI